MPKASPIQTNFTAGEISPRMLGRTDINKYANGARKLSNFIVRPQGGIFARTGTRFIVEAKDSSKQIMLVEFEFSDIQSYILEFGENYIRFIKNRAQIAATEIATPYTAAELPYLQLAQSADVLYIVHGAHPPMQLERTSDTVWDLVEYVNLDGPYLPTNITDVSMQISNQVDTAIITSDANDFAVGNVGKYIEYTRNGVRVIALITNFIDAKNLRVTPLENIIASIDPTAILTYAAPNLTSTETIFSSDNVGSFISTAAGVWYLITAYTSTSALVVSTALNMVPYAGHINLNNRVITANVMASSATFASGDVGRVMRFNFASQQYWGRIKAFTDNKNISLSLDRPIATSILDTRSLSPSLNGIPATSGSTNTTTANGGFVSGGSGGGGNFNRGGGFGNGGVQP